jgi:hypothetical protein
MDMKYINDLKEYSDLSMPFYRRRVHDAGKDFAGNKSGDVGI